MARSHAVTLVALLGVVLLCGCGSSSNQTAKQARIETALRKLERELAAEKRAPLLHVTHGDDLLGVLTLFSEPAPPGVNKAEWQAALGHDRRIHQLEMEASVTPTGKATAIELATPAAVVRAGGQRLTEFEAGKRAVAQSGCLACHKIGANGNDGPGPDLTEVGGRLPPLAIARTLINPTAPMPSFKNLPPAKFHAIVAFLSELK